MRFFCSEFCSCNSIVPSGWSSNFSPSSVNLNSGESTNVNWSVTSDSQAPEDNYGVTAEATDDTEQTFTGSDNANYEVNNSAPVCGDGTCDAGEDCSSCPGDCGSCTICGDGTCDAGEDCNSCAADCISGGGVSCGNGICEAADGEDCNSCADDCNSKTKGNPKTHFCCGEAGVCGSSQCNNDPFSCTEATAQSYCCGDSVCEGAEDSVSCEVDCPLPVCSDNTCDPGEDSCSCAADCGAPPADEVGLCSDGVDNDCDGDIDCDDGDCATDLACSCLPVGSSCSASGDCCSNKCKGKAGAKVCK